MTTETSNARGEVVAWVAEFPDGWKEFAADGEPEVTEWPTWRQPPSTIRPLAYADIAHLSTPADWRERLEALSSRYEPNSPVGSGIDAAIRELTAAQQPAAVDEAGCMHGCRCGCCRACKRGHYEPARHSTCDCYATQHQEPTT